MKEERKERKGKKMKAGEPISSAKVRKVRKREVMEVNRDLIFTGHIRTIASKAAWKLMCPARITHSDP